MHPPEQNPGHLTIDYTTGVGNLTRKMTFALVRWQFESEVMSKSFD